MTNGDRLSVAVRLGRSVFRSSGPRRQAMRSVVSSLLLGLALIVVAPAAAWANFTLPAVGDTVVNPVTGLNETVTQVISPAAVETNNNNVIVVSTTVGDTYTDPGTGHTLKVTAVTTNGLGFVTGVTVTDQTTSTPSNLTVVQNATAPAGPSAGSGSTPFTFPTAAGDHVYTDIKIGQNGGNGHGGGGVKIFGVCICYSPSDGAPGAAGPTLNDTVVNGAGLGPYTSVSDNLPAISVASYGGNGGKGGFFVGYGNAASGGAAGPGGDVTVTSHADASTTGIISYGILAQSSAGKGGDGGNGYFIASGGTGGGPAVAGSVTVTNYGGVTTQGRGAIGILAESLGGSAGSGGSSYGIVAQGGGGSAGGDGGTVTVNQYGNVQTSGTDAHGVLAQSVGGDGGNAGTAGAIVALGEDNASAFGGKGGAVSITAGATSQTITTGDNAVGLFAQSIGGGGGNGGVSAGLVALGSQGGGGGDGGAATVTVLAGATVSTGGAVAGVVHGGSSHDIFAQSVGGGGGASGVTGGLVALGGSGAGGGSGGTVTVDSAGALYAGGLDARGIFAQSVGGGGGAGQGTGGLVSLGASGAGGGGGGGVTVTQEAAGTIITEQKGGDGIFAQSVGGGGGAGSASGGLVSIGGMGSGGGAGGTVIVTNNGSIATHGGLARGVFAQSVGGGGGTGGDSGGLVSIGGGSSTSSAGGNVTITNDGGVTTTGAQSSGLQAQSIGGGGGDGGTSGGLVSIGGSGGGGGSSGAVTVNEQGSISTTGNDSHGIFAQAIGGGGGNGGASYSGGIFAGVAVGGSGAGAGDGGEVDLTLIPTIVNVGGSPHSLNPVITTTGDRSRGIFAQSVGGGGGNGGVAIQASVGAFGSASFAVGGSGAGGGAGGLVNLNGDVSITTGGVNSEGLLTQSVGGGGGNGGGAISVSASGGLYFSASLSVAIGGSAGSGGVGGTVDVNSGGSIQTTGDFSTGFEAQSVGGGGGNGGYSVSVAVTGSSGAAVSAALGMGGSGGTGGAGGSATGVFDGPILTHGVNADGAVIQSVGGGGGTGGWNVSGAVAGGAVAGVGVAVGLGGEGGGGGLGGTVNGTIGNNVTTTGDRSTAVVIQSIGGGGGSGGFNVSGQISVGGDAAVGASVGLGGSGGGGGAGGQVTGAVNGDIATGGANANGLIVQSIGGGGGNGGFNVSAGVALAETAAGNIGVGIGGSGGSGGAGGIVIGGMTGAVNTTGDNASGIIVQSVGGGGGDGGFNVSGGIAGASSVAGNLMVGVGGFGGSGGGAGAVSGTVTGDITTLGKNSGGLTYQSLGGGGGNGGFNVSGGISVNVGDGGAGTVGVGVGGFGGGGGGAGTVTANYAGDIFTTSSGAYGALMQSAGGGGGNGAFNVTGGISAGSGASGVLGVGIGGFGGGGGGSSLVTGTLTGDVTTLGNNAYGAKLQSVGGAGGNGGINVTGGIAVSIENNVAGSIGIGVGGFGGSGGTAGGVTGTVTGLYQTGGSGAPAVVAQSVGGGGGAGGLNVTGDIAASTGANGTLGVGIGGFGGGGGGGGTVMLTRVGDTFTTGQSSDAVTAQSVGGGGGSGAINVTGGLNGTTSGTSVGISFGLGGFGGGGGAGGDVTLSVTGNVEATGVASAFGTLIGTGPAIITRANGSGGVMAQSVGGGGGSGGLNVTGQLSVSAPSSGSSYSAAIGIGGFGGSGGSAGTVNLTIAPPGASAVDVVASGDNKSAAIAQSLGGGGGVGAIDITGGVAMDGTLAAGVGGFGGGGGVGGVVNATVTANLWADGTNSRGLMAQSIGGGGGAGGINISGAVTASTKTSAPSLAFGLGGFGGAGNAANNVTVHQSGQIVVEGQNSDGILAQSIGGGGGAGGMNVTADVTLSNQKDGFGFAVGIGGSGGAGANPGFVNLTSAGDIFVNAVPTTVGGVTTYAGVTYLDSNSGGIVAQSIGGGGGVGGLSITGAIAPFGNPVAIGVGGTGADGGDGNTVTVVRGYNGLVPAAANIRVFGDASPGLFAQSLGGGGGKAGMNFTIAATKGNGTDDPIAAIITIGGGTGDGGSSAAVNVTQNGNIYTKGVGSDGLEALSIGGGGGDANYNIGFGIEKGANALNLAIGGGIGDGGAGSTVHVTQTGVIQTNGASSDGIFAQSLGGGGGNSVMDMAMGLASKNALNITIGRKGGSGGVGQNVTVIQSGVIGTNGDMSTDITAQSIGGGGGKSGAITVAVQAETKSKDATDSYNGSLSIGLDGGTGATSGVVNVTAAGFLSTLGKQSQGIFAQSVGGGGGIGGLAANTFFNSAGNLGLAIGGTGGTGAISGAVTVNTSATITTVGDLSDGVLAQSIGGGGGEGGSTRTLNLEIGLPALLGGGTTQNENSLVVNVGGHGGTGGNGDTVNVTNTGIIETQGLRSFGIRAQSIGGGGGAGGAVLNLALQLNDSNDSNTMSVNIGGAGGTGGTGAAVGVINHGYIGTSGIGAIGIVAQSVGGGGGDAGLVLDVTGGKPGTEAETHSFLLDIGGTGGSGGSAGAVTVTNQGTGAAFTGEIITTGVSAYGILAQSIGGGGGNGSSIIQITALQTGKDSSTAGLAIGGAGGTGNTGGNVTVTNGGLVDTSGIGAHGIVAQSVGGGGGNGGMSIAANLTINATASTPLISIGGSGGDGGNGGTVIVNNAGEIITRGPLADGVLAQSIGGGGGNANMGFALTGEVNTLVISNALAAIVGSVSGGTGGTGGHVTVNQTGDITVLGAGSQAIVAQSINGGGGNLSLDFSGITGLPGVPYVSGGMTITPMPAITAVVGGTGNQNMGGGAVTINATGTFGAAGANGAGGLLQSIGGGGGVSEIISIFVPVSTDPTITGSPAAIPVTVALGGTNGVNNAGGDTSAGYTGAVTTTASDTPAQLTQSIGGGGGRGVIDLTVPAGTLLGDITVGLGGTNGLNEAGGAVVFAQNGALGTSGVLSPGTLLQSIGGGGGLASVVLQGTGASGVTLVESLGSNGGTGLGAGPVTGTFTGGVTTLGNHSVGLFFQSIGGGGGLIDMTGVSAYSVALGGTNGASGNGGAITIANTGAINTTGVGSHAVFLQSIGGGGGAVIGDPAIVTLGTINTGDGGPVSFTQVGDVSASGVGAYGIIAQSVGGGGGWVDGLFSGTAGGSGHGGTITLGVTGNVRAFSTGSYAIYADSSGGLGAGNIAITINSGAIIGGDGSGASIGFQDGANNTLVNHGGISPINGVAGFALRGGSGNEAIDNYNQVIGSIDLGGGVNSFHNHAGNFFEVGPSLLLGAGTGLMTNDGTFQIGASAPLLSQDLTAAQTTTETGSFVQTATGHLVVDLSYGPFASDRINITGGTASLGGTVDITLLKLQNDQPLTLITTTGGASVNGAVAPGTLALTFTPQAVGHNIQIDLTPHFQTPLTRPNAQAIGLYLNHTLDVGGAVGLNDLLLFLGEEQDLGVYRRAFDLISPEPFLAPYQVALYAGEDAASNVMSCKTADTTAAAITETGCGWVKVATKTLHRRSNDTDFGFDDVSQQLSTGVQRKIGSNLYVGASLGWDVHTTTEADVPASGNGAFLTGAAVVKWQDGPGLAALAISGGGGQFSSSRTINVLGSHSAAANMNVSFVTVEARGAWLFEHNDLYAKPTLDLVATNARMGSFAEVGAGPIGSRSGGANHTSFAIKPSLELGGDIHGADGFVLRPWASIGAAFRPDASFDLPVSFVGSTLASGTYTITTKVDRIAATIDTGLEFIKPGRYTISLGYAGEYSRSYGREGGRFKIAIPF
jgi:hypothetical protein